VTDRGAAVLARRAAVLARPLAAAAGVAAPALEFNIAGAECVLELKWVREVRPVRELVCLPMPARHVRGVASIRGDMVPILETAELLGLPGTGDPAMILLLGEDAIDFGIVADSIGGVAELSTTHGNAMRDFQPAVVNGCTHDGRAIVDGRSLLAFANTILGERSPT
jgi:purine-binding chemotaxis protein CheW